MGGPIGKIWATIISSADPYESPKREVYGSPVEGADGKDNNEPSRPNAIATLRVCHHERATANNLWGSAAKVAVSYIYCAFSLTYNRWQRSEDRKEWSYNRINMV